MVDNFSLIKPLLKFEDPYDCYFIMILLRKKDGHPEAKDSHRQRIIKYYLVRNLEYLEEKENEIKKLCQVFNARAVINLNRRNYKKLALRMMQELAQLILDENYFVLNHLITSVAGKYRSEREKKFIIDLDKDNLYLKDDILKALPSIVPEGEKFIIDIPSKSGVHLITKPFNIKEFKDKFPKIDIHKDNPTNLYIP